ncbi:MAG: diaminopimelate epimerase [Gemmatimonadales bacterium]|nr:diaminopimelate epimerase [Gemmatimonadales bacterium]
MRPVHFYKMTGSGNDFVALDGRETTVADWTPEAIRAACDRRTGVGADGLVILTPEGRDGVRMTFFNNDGSPAGMCGNAALCSTRLAHRIGLVAGTEMSLYTESGTLQTRCVGPGWMAELLLNDFDLPALVDVPLRPGEHWVTRCTVGVPHGVVLVDDLASTDVVGRGRELRRDPAFAPGGANINFVGRDSSTGGGVAWRVRTYERGVEGETMACGTGTVGAAFALAERGLVELPVRIASWHGNVFSVAGRIEGRRAVGPWLCGEGRMVFEGEGLISPS